jgi:hypothetical protein
MDQHCIDCRDVQTIHALLHELSKSNNCATSQPSFTYNQSNGIQTSMVRVPTSNKYQWFVHNIPSTWVPNILDVVCPEIAEENNGDKGNNEVES